MAHLTIVQADGAGSFAEDAPAGGLWVGKEITMTLSSGATYLHEIRDVVKGSILSGIQDHDHQAGRWTPDRVGSFRITSTVTLSSGATFAITRVYRVTKDSSGNLVRGGIVAPSKGEVPSETPEGARGYADIHDDLLDFLRGTNLGEIPSSSDLDTPIVLVGKSRVTYTGPVAARLVLANDGHADGAEMLIDFPMGSATSVKASLDFNLSGDCSIDPDPDSVTAFQITDWDPAIPNVVALERVGGITYGSVRKGRVPDTTAPTFASRIVASGNPNALVCSMSEPVCWRSPTGLSLTFSAGTPRTITAIESGDGTKVTTFTLSGDFTGTEVCNLVVGVDCEATDYSGNPIAPGTYPIAVNFGYVMPSERHLWRGDAMATAGSNVTSVVDQTGADPLVAGATKPTTVTVGGKPFWTNIAGSYLSADLAAPETPSAFAILIVFNATTAPNNYSTLSCTGQSANHVVHATNIIIWKAVDYANANRDALVGTGYVETFAAGINNNNTHAILHTGDDAGAKLYLASGSGLVEIATSSAAFTAIPIGRVTMGVDCDLSSAPATGIAFGEQRRGAAKIVPGANMTALNAYLASEYGL
jgi:hypothetical protein